VVAAGRGGAFAASAETPLAAHGLRLPATFSGDLPCADCAGIRHQLNLWPDQVFMLRRTWLGKDGVRDDIGRWSIDPERQALILWAGTEMPLQFEILNNQRLRLLDLTGKPIDSPLPYELVSQDALQPIDVSLFLSGMFVYFADAARLTECLTGRSFPVAMEGDYLALERAYLEKRKAPAEPLMATFEGSIAQRPRMEGEGTEATVIVQRFINLWPGESCERNRAQASLTNTYWRIVRIGDEELSGTEGRREPHLLLRAGEPRFAATVGCNQMICGFEVAGERVKFEAGPMTMMACPPPLDQLEQRFIATLNAVRSWRIIGQVLELQDAAGKPVALLQAVYLR
jgi:heat shock protein HslJ